jgi:hypothetical protein
LPSERAALRNHGPIIEVAVSNDNGRALSNYLQISVPNKLPYIKGVERPTLFIADSRPVDIIFKVEHVTSTVAQYFKVISR